MKILSLRIKVSVILLVGAVFITGCSSAKLDEKASEKPIHQFSVKEGKRLFQRLCFPCHGESGKGNGIYWASAMDITPADLTKFSPAESSRIFKTIKYGSEAQGKSNLCPSWKNNISDEEIEYIVSYVETLE
ncbi:MAG: c-type cytochrome [Candidatus Mariimomonas ferrooxydans]